MGGILAIILYLPFRFKFINQFANQLLEIAANGLKSIGVEKNYQDNKYTTEDV
jgi:hypothetical protein